MMNRTNELGAQTEGQRIRYILPAGLTLHEARGEASEASLVGPSC